jgi:hypothetical protein
MGRQRFRKSECGGATAAELADCAGIQSGEDPQSREEHRQFLAVCGQVAPRSAFMKLLVDDSAGGCPSGPRLPGSVWGALVKLLLLLAMYHWAGMLAGLLGR